MSAANQIPVLEIFGPTIQGEGMVIGRKTMFVRTPGCDYRCSWCDSAYTWDGSARDDIRRMSAEEIADELFAIGGSRFNHVTISGGNPALYGQIGELVELLAGRGIKTGLETQGSRWQDWFPAIEDLTLSPKPPSSGMNPDFDVLDDIIERLRNTSRIDHHVSLKIVVFNDADFEWAENIHKRYPDVPFYLQVGNDDSVTDDTENLTAKLLDQLEWLADKAVASSVMNDAKVLPQLHTLMWGNKRGV